MFQWLSAKLRVLFGGGEGDEGKMTKNHVVAAKGNGSARSMEGDVAIREILKVLTFYEDHPIKGHQFVDIFPIFRRPDLTAALINAFAQHIRSLPDFSKVTSLLVLEARGFVFGPLVAHALSLPFVPVRKRGKLPGTTLSVSYAKEYEEDVFEIKNDAFEGIPEGNVILLDDLVAMGGSAAAGKGCVEKLAEQLGQRRKVVEACFVFGIPELEERVKDKLGETRVWSWIDLRQEILPALPRGT